MKREYNSKNLLCYISDIGDESLQKQYNYSGLGTDI